MPQDWTGQTGGTKWMQQSLIVLFRYIDVRIIYAIMAIVIVFYMIFRPYQYIAIYKYFIKCHNYTPLRAVFAAYTNYYMFGQAILDRFAAYAGKKYNFILEDKNIEKTYNNTEEGLLVIASHIGNYELAGYSFFSSNKDMHIIAFDGETETIMKNRLAMFNANNIHIIPIKKDLSHVFSIYEALTKGDIVSIHGDRMMDAMKELKCNFFNKQASFPIGPFQIAAVINKPIITMFVMKDKWNTYHIYSFFLKANYELKKEERIADLAQQYAKHIEEVICKYPHQWFQFYDFWKK